MPYTETQLYGDLLFRQSPDVPGLRSGEIHTLKQRWQAPQRYPFSLGAAPDGAAAMRIISIDPEEEITDAAYDVRVECEGILDGRSHLELDRSEDSAEEGWDLISLSAYTLTPNATRWQKGQRLQADPITGISGEADDEKLTKANAFAALSTGRMAYFDFASGFSGLTSGTAYYVIKIDDDNIKLATTLANANAGTAINITADGTGGTLRPVIAGMETMFITDRRKRRARGCVESEALGIAGYYYVDLQLKGLLAGEGDFKGIKRRINTTAQALSTTNFGSAIVIDPVYTGPASNPATSSTTTYTLAGNVEFDLPQISVTDTMISTSAPPTHLVPSNWIPDNAPTITVVSISGTNDIYHYPSGWKVLNLQSEQIPGQNLWLISLTWGYQRANTPQA
jgi:hypothetical protein